MSEQYEKTKQTLVAFHVDILGQKTQAYFIGEGIPIVNYTNGLKIGYENQEDILERFQDQPDKLSIILKAMVLEDFASLKDLGLKREDFGQKVYTDQEGISVGLEVDNDGTGCIQLENPSSTTYVCKLSECGEEELKLILKPASAAASKHIISYCRERLGIREKPFSKDVGKSFESSM